jgi:hypothetical protein
LPSGEENFGDMACGREPIKIAYTHSLFQLDKEPTGSDGSRSVSKK